MKRSVRARIWMPLLVLGLVNCSGSLDRPDDESGASGSGGTGNPGNTENGVPVTTRVARLTHPQYDNTVSHLLGDTVEPSVEFLADPTFSGFDNNAEALRVEGRLGRDYRRAAETLAELVATSLLDGILPCEPTANGCSEQFVEDFGLRTFRRPLSAEEITRYVGLFDQGATLVASGNDFADGVRVVVEAMLQSPKFLYRAELGTEVDETGFIPLNDYEVATRLAYMLWNTTPDDTLLSRAEAGSLTDPQAIYAEAERLLEDDRVSEPVLDFHHQWLELDHYQDIAKDPNLFPAFSPESFGSLQEETRRFVEYVTLDQGLGLQELLTASYTFANADVGGMYGIDSGLSTEFERVDLDASQRRGLLTQIGFLTSHAYTDDTSPIHRGVFILRKILCVDIPDPPGDVDFTLPEPSADIVTTRDQLEAHTGTDSCSPCHDLINPVGYAFENYDAIGQWRETDAGEPVDTTGTLRLPEGEVSFANAMELIDRIAASESARHCYAENWLRYAFAREVFRADDQTLAALAESLAANDYSPRQLLADLTQARSFRYRAPNPD